MRSPWRVKIFFAHVLLATTTTSSAGNGGKQGEIEAQAVEAWARDVAVEHGFRDPQHIVDIYGTCARCHEGRGLARGLATA